MAAVLRHVPARRGAASSAPAREGPPSATDASEPQGVQIVVVIDASADAVVSALSLAVGRRIARGSSARCAPGGASGRAEPVPRRSTAPPCLRQGPGTGGIRRPGGGASARPRPPPPAIRRAGGRCGPLRHGRLPGDLVRRSTRAGSSAWFPLRQSRRGPSAPRRARPTSTPPRSDATRLDRAEERERDRPRRSAHSGARARIPRGSKRATQIAVSAPAPRRDGERGLIETRFPELW